MSKIVQMEIKCFVCGRESKQDVLLSSNTFFGSRDLDLRPPDMMRSTMGIWVQECPHCGYISGSLKSKTAVTEAWLKDKAYRTCGKRVFRSELAKRFFKHHTVCIEDDDHRGAFFALLYAAWASDDKGDLANAEYCRKRALEEKFEAEPGECESFELRKADMMRRAGMFDQMIEKYGNMSFTNELHAKIIKFQLELARERNRCCYTVADIEKDGE